MAKQSLSREQKEAMILLQVGSFLEYFDLLLYVHMAVLLNELFFPQSDPGTASLLATFSFCATFVFRPIGALFFGFIGDRFGRKQTIIFTTLLMAISCIMMANLPPYSRIGITAAWLVTLCRALQSISSLGEVVGAELYLTEMVKPPLQYPVVSTISLAALLGGIAALGMASLVTTTEINWRMAFWLGALIACIGTAARTRLREAPEFIDMKRRVKRAIEEAKESGLGASALLLSKSNPIWKVKVERATLINFFFVFCADPLSFYIVYIYCGDIMKSDFGFTSAQIIQQNLLVSSIYLVGALIQAGLTYKIHPLTILKVKAGGFLAVILGYPFILTFIHTPLQLLLLQSLIAFTAISDFPAAAIFYSHFPVLRRFTCVSWIFALSRAFMFIITSFGLVCFTKLLGYWGLWMIALPVCLGFFCGVSYFERLENPTIGAFKRAG